MAHPKIEGEQARVVGMPYGDRGVDVDKQLRDIQAANPGVGLMAALSVLEQKDPELFVPLAPDWEFDQNAREKFQAARRSARPMRKSLAKHGRKNKHHGSAKKRRLERARAQRRPKHL